MYCNISYEAVNFIIEQELKDRDQKLILLPIGKLTNIALALKKESAIAKNIRIVWLGSNYPVYFVPLQLFY